MSNNLVIPDDEDDGFHWSSVDGRVVRGTIIQWNAEKGWHDRDGGSVPSPMLVLGVTTVLRRWVQDENGNMRPDYIVDQPTPDPAIYNNKIPKSEWKTGLNGELRPPWEHCCVVYLIDPVSGLIYTFQTTTWGGHRAFDLLNEATVGKRLLFGVKIKPVVALEVRPWKTRFGMKTRPHFQPVDWREPGVPQVAAAPRPQLSGPTAMETTPADQPKTKPVDQPETKAANPSEPKTAAQLALDKMTKPKPISPSEALDDVVPW
jgi:hypothetical protein